MATAPQGMPLGYLMFTYTDTSVYWFYSFRHIGSSLESKRVRTAIVMLGVNLTITACATVVPSSSIKPRSDAVLRDYFAWTVFAPPSWLIAKFNLDTTFYRKYADAAGIPIMASAKVPDEALVVARDIVQHMLSVRPDLRADIIARGGRVGVMAITEMTTDVPEQRDWKKPAIDDRRLTPGERERYNQPGGIGSMTDREYWNRRARGMGGTYTTGAEENILGYPGTRYYGEHILVHEFSHSIMASVRRVDLPLYAELEAAYADAMAKGMYARHYAANTIAEYWAEGTQWWFWSNFPATFGEQRLWTPDELKAYDPKLFDILRRVYPDHRIPLDIYHGVDRRAELRRGG